MECEFKTKYRWVAPPIPWDFIGHFCNQPDNETPLNKIYHYDKYNSAATYILSRSISQN
jgi:hypothetical protein